MWRKMIGKMTKQERDDLNDWLNTNSLLTTKSMEGKMEIKEYTKPTGSFLKASDIIENPTAIFTILGEGELVTSEKFGNERLHLPGELDKEAKTFDCSKTNARKIEETLGTDTAKWVGKQILFEVYKTKTSDGKLVDALNVKEVRV